jgi:hypothetical protein
MKHDNNKTGKAAASEAFERQVFRTLVEKGHIIPETENEVGAAEERMKAEEAALPDELPDARTILARIKGRKKAGGKKVVPMAQNQFTETGEELARAARKGAEIPPEIEEKLRLNRAKADAASKRNSESN